MVINKPDDPLRRQNCSVHQFIHKGQRQNEKVESQVIPTRDVQAQKGKYKHKIMSIKKLKKLFFSIFGSFHNAVCQF